jgi:enamine deaminase RidA (YjgF/YER057c/UK114 family)
MDRHNISSGSPFESRIGISRAVRIGNIVAVAGTAPLTDGKTAHPGDVYAQTKRCIEIMLEALATAGGSAQHVIRTRVLLTDIATWQDAARAHNEAFGAIRPANTIVEISRFIDPEWLVETELDAVV